MYDGSHRGYGFRNPKHHDLSAALQHDWPGHVLDAIQDFLRDVRLQCSPLAGWLAGGLRQVSLRLCRPSPEFDFAA